MPLIPRARARAALWLVLMLSASPALAQGPAGFEMRSHVFGAGGGNSTGGDFQLAGTAGQHDAGALTGGDFTLAGGFWPSTAPVVAGVGPVAITMVPLRLALPAPNPFRGSTTLAFALERDTPVRLMVFDIAGHRVRTLLEGTQSPGVHHVAWNGASERGSRMSPGIYFIHLDAGSVRTTRRVVLLD
jgi:hypothetical protein